MTFKKIRFVTDSCSDIPPDLVEKYQIGVVPTFVNYGDKSYADDGVELIREEYYRQLPSIIPFPTTSAVSPAQSEEVITKTYENADHLFVITVASKLSAVYNTMRLACEKLPPDRVTIIDSRSVTLGLGFQVLIGAETAEATGDVDQVQAAILRARDHARVYAALDTMEFLRRSGRVSWATANIGALLQIKPVIEVVDGEVKSVSRVRTFSRATEELIRLAQVQMPLERLAVLYISDHDDAVKFRERLADIVPPNTLIVSVTPTIGSHVGTGGLGLATISRST